MHIQLRTETHLHLKSVLKKECIIHMYTPQKFKANRFFILKVYKLIQFSAHHRPLKYKQLQCFAIALKPHCFVMNYELASSTSTNRPYRMVLPCSFVNHSISELENLWSICLLAPIVSGPTSQESGLMNTWRATRVEQVWKL